MLIVFCFLFFVMKCIIIGLGNFGMALAQRLTAMGYEVIGVDKDIDKVLSLIHI